MRFTHAMLHDRIRFSTEKHSIDVHIEDPEHAIASSTRYQERYEPLSDPQPGVHDWYLGRAEQLVRMIDSREEHYLTNLHGDDGPEIAEWALTIAHGTRGLSVALNARDEMRDAAARFRFVSQRAAELLTVVRSYEPHTPN